MGRDAIIARGARVLAVLWWTGIAWAAPERAWVDVEALGTVSARDVHVDHGRSWQDGRRWVEVTAEPEVLRQLGPAARPLPPRPPAAPGYDLPGEGASERLAGAVDRAERAGLWVVGHSVDGRPIEAAWFGRPPGSGAPALRVEGAHHGDELVSLEMALVVAEALADEPRLAASLADRTVWVIPWVNPDGVHLGTRSNASGVDLNRNYDRGWSELETFGGPGPLSEPETRAMVALGAVTRPVLGLSLHAGASNIGYPWNHTEEPAPDRSSLIAMADDYADDCLDPRFWVTNGAEWYITYGDSSDEAYARWGSWDFTLELSGNKSPPVEYLDPIMDAHLEPVLDFLAQPLVGLTVVDVDGQPVEAWVDAGGQRRWTDPLTGQVGLPGGLVGPVTVGAPGYGEVLADPGEQVILEDGDRRVVPPVPLWEAGRVTLPGVGATRWLHLAGEPSLRVEVDRGAAFLDPTELATGFWTVEDEGGAVYPRALAVGLVAAPTRRGDLWWGRPLVGAWGWQLDARGELIAAEVRPDGTIASDGAPVMLWADGELVIAAKAGWSETAGDRQLVARGVACAHPQGMGHLAWVVGSVLLTRRRRSG